MMLNLPVRSLKGLPSWTVALTVYLGIALAYLVLPLRGRWDSALLGTSIYASDNILNAGLLEWGYKSLPGGLSRFFDPPMGFPLDDTLAVGENLIGWQIFYAPLRLLGVGNVAAMNVLVIVAILISAMGANALARHFGADKYGALVAGLIFGFVPIHLSHLHQFQTLSICWVPFAVLALDRTIDEPSIRRAVLLASLFFLTAASSLYAGFFLAITILLFVGLTFLVRGHRPSWPIAGHLLLAGTLALLLLLPLIMPYLRFATSYGYREDLEKIIVWSSSLLDFFQTWRWLAMWRNTPLSQRPGYGGSFPGFGFTFLVASLLFSSFRRRENLDRHVFLLALLVILALMSLGPVLKIHNYPSRLAPYVPLPGRIFAWVPGLRVPSRILLYGVVFGAVLAGLGMSAVLARLRSRWQHIVATGAIAFLAIEYLPIPTLASSSFNLPPPAALSDVYAFAGENLDRAPMVELPSMHADSVPNLMMALYVYASAAHLRRTASYYGGTRLALADNLQRKAEALPDSASLQTLLDAGVRYLAVHTQFMRSHEAAVGSWPP